MSIIASLPHDLALYIGRLVEKIRWQDYFSKCVLPDIPCEVESINQQRKELEVTWACASQGDDNADGILLEWDERHSEYEIIPPTARVRDEIFPEKDPEMYWELDEDGDWIPCHLYQGIPAHKRRW